MRNWTLRQEDGLTLRNIVVEKAWPKADTGVSKA